jgi:FtsP/CotA-like multicopper oxidase with cupredoxin domain
MKWSEDDAFEGSKPPQISNNSHSILPFLSSVITDEAGTSFMGIANNITFDYPKFPLLLETDRVTDDMFCDKDTPKSKETCSEIFNHTICRCVHRIKFKLNSIAEIVIVNVNDKLGHPLHLHGHKFHVVDAGLLKEGMSEEEVKRSIPRGNLRNPPYKDTVRLMGREER